MTTDTHGERLDQDIRRFLDLRANDTSQIRSATDMSVAIAARVLPAQDRAARIRLAWALTAASLVALLAASAVIVGGQRKAEVSLDSSVLPAPTVATVPSMPLPVDRLIVAATGTEDTAIGRVSWTKLIGGATNVPAADIFETPDGYAALEPNIDGPGARLWRSNDGVNWSVALARVPAVGQLSHRVVAGEHWLWSRQDFALWHSTDLNDWREVDLASFRPPAIDGIDWGFGSSGPVTLGSTTVVPWTATGTLALDRLLGITVPPGEGLIVNYRGETPALGGVRDVVMTRKTGTSSVIVDDVRVGGIRVELDGQIVKVLDADHDRVVAEIDSTSLGVPAADVARTLHQSGRFFLGASSVAVTDSVASDAGLPADIEYLIARDGRFVAMTKPGDGDLRVAWTSTNGRNWESAGAPRLPEVRSSLGFFVGSHTDPEAPLMSHVFLNTDPQREELWTSADGIDWDQLSVLSTYPSTSRRAWPLPSGGFLAITGLHTVEASVDGIHWTPMQGLDDVGKSADANGGQDSTFIGTHAATFIEELPIGGARILWVLDVTP